MRSKSVRANSPKSNKNIILSTNSIIAATCIAIAVWFGYKGYLETRVNTPYDVEKACNVIFILYFIFSNRRAYTLIITNNIIITMQDTELHIL